MLVFKYAAYVIGVYLFLGMLFFTLVDFTIPTEDKAEWESIPWLTKFVYTICFWVYIFVKRP